MGETIQWFSAESFLGRAVSTSSIQHPVQRLADKVRHATVDIGWLNFINKTNHSSPEGLNIKRVEESDVEPIKNHQHRYGIAMSWKTEDTLLYICPSAINHGFCGLWARFVRSVFPSAELFNVGFDSHWCVKHEYRYFDFEQEMNDGPFIEVDQFRTFNVLKGEKMAENGSIILENMFINSVGKDEDGFRYSFHDPLTAADIKLTADEEFTIGDRCAVTISRTDAEDGVSISRIGFSYGKVTLETDANVSIEDIPYDLLVKSGITSVRHKLAVTLEKMN